MAFLLAHSRRESVWLGYTAVGTFGSSWIADKIQSILTGKKSTATMDAMKKVGPTVGGIVLGAAGGSALPAAAPAAPRLALALEESINSALLARYGEKIVQHAPRVKDFVEGALIEGPPAMTKWGTAGYGLNYIYNESKKRK